MLIHRKPKNAATPPPSPPSSPPPPPPHPLLALALSLALAAPGAAWAQRQQLFSYVEPEPEEEVLVTGSYIKGRVEEAPNPITVLTRESLVDMGHANVLDLVQGLGISAGTDGRSNQYQTAGQEGSANINLRGVGPGRTLVLLNGQRLSSSGVASSDEGYQQFINLNTLPMLAVERVQVLRDGASAVYGSDALAGVVSFTTRDSFEGLELSFNNSLVGDSGGNDMGVVWGQNFGPDAHLLLAFGYNIRGELAAADRDWASPEVEAGHYYNGWSSAGNPGVFWNSEYGTGFVDPGCGDITGTEISGTAVDISAANRWACAYRATQHDNIIEGETRYQFYTKYDLSFAGGSKLEISALIANIDVSDWKTAASGPPLASSRNQIFRAHPGFIALANTVNRNHRFTNPTVRRHNLDSLHYLSICTFDNGGGGTAWGFPDYNTQNFGCHRGGTPRNITLGGYTTDANGLIYHHLSPTSPTSSTTSSDNNPVLRYEGRALGWGAGAQAGSRSHDTLNLTYSYSFQMGGGSTEAVLQGGYFSQSSSVSRPDMVAERFQLALRGYGGPGCTLTAAQVADVLEATTSEPVTGGSGCLYYNPFTNAIATHLDGTDNPNYNDNTANDPALVSWLFGQASSSYDTTLLNTEVIFSGDFGDHSWAGGGQLRLESYDGGGSGLYAQGCAYASSTNGCAHNLDGGAFAFLGRDTPYSGSETVLAGFGEVELNLGEALTLQVAGRFETYSEAGASSLVPKVAVRWGLLDFLTLRGAFGQGFKAPQLAQLGANDISPQYISLLGGYEAVETTAHGLGAESSTNTNIGVVIELGGLSFSFDTWLLDLSDPIQRESAAGILAAVCPIPEGGSPTATRMCDYDHATLADRLIIDGMLLSEQSADQPLESGTLDRVKTRLINGPGISASGFDVMLRYSFVNWVNPMEVGMEWANRMGDHAGELNAEDHLRPLPGDKYRFYWNMDLGPMHFAADYSLIGGYTDERAVFGQVAPGTQDIDAWGTLNFNFVYSLREGKTKIYADIDNLAGEDPPYARLDLAYDPYTHSPLGQIIKLGLVHQF